MTTRRRLLGGALATLGLGCAGLAPIRFGGTRTELRDTVEGRLRVATLVVPSTYDRTRRWPLVLGSHGHDQTARTMVEGFGWGSTCEEHGYLGVFPTSPNDGEGEPDNAFFVHLIERIQAEYAVDPARIFATGFSAGCKRVYSFAANESRRIAAMAGHSGKIGHLEDDPARWDPRYTGAAPVSVIHVHGRKDERVPLEGGLHVTPDGVARHVIPTRDALEIWAGVDDAFLVPAARPPADVPARCQFHRWVAADGRLVEGVIDPALAHEWSAYANRLFVDFFARVPGRAPAG